MTKSKKNKILLSHADKPVSNFNMHIGYRDGISPIILQKIWFNSQVFIFLPDFFNFILQICKSFILTSWGIIFLSKIFAPEDLHCY